MAGSHVIPEVYFPDVDDQELHTSDVEGEGGPGGGSAEGQTEDLTKEGFIPIYKLTLDDLPEDIRTEENLQHILDMAKRAVFIFNSCVSDERPDHLKKRGQKKLKGSGRLTVLNEEDNIVLVLTNRHVIFNKDELEQSTFDVFYDCDHENPDKKLRKRCGRKQGHSCINMYTTHDVTMASFHVKKEMVERIKEHSPQHEEELMPVWCTQLPVPNHGASTVPTVCLISHPLGKPKHVSFGHLVDVNFHTLTLHHTAPSKQGSSGAPLMVFTNENSLGPTDSDIYHVATSRDTGYKIAKFGFTKNFLIDDYKALMEQQQLLSDNMNCSLDELAIASNTFLEREYLAAFVPVFGAFLLHTEKYGLEGMDLALFKPCETREGATSTSSVFMEPHVRNFLQRVKQLVPDFNWGSSSSPGEEPDLASLLTPQGPCFCQSIVKQMERGVKSGDSTLTESFLSPDTAAVKMCSNSDVTWPWLNRRECDVSSICAEEEECLMKKCLQDCKSPYVTEAATILLLMMRKANASIARFLPHSGNVSMTTQSDDDKTHTEVIYSRTEEASSRELTSEKRGCGERKSPSPAAEVGAKSLATSLEADCVGFARFIFPFAWIVVRFHYVQFFSLGLHDKNGALSKQKEGDNMYNACFSRYLARSKHDMHHYWQNHPDTKTPECGDACPCGRPSFPEVFWSLYCHAERAMPGEMDHHEECLGGPAEQELEQFTFAFFHKLQKEALEKQPDNPGNFILNFLDNCGHFPHGFWTIIFLQASLETLLYNCRQLLRQINKTVKIQYFAFPASVYGRPGNWPGNVTPPEVQRKAWRLIQDAFMESGFPPAVLADLEEDAERRQRLIDVYVDMKQLKWQGRIQPHLLWEWLEIPKIQYHQFFFGTQSPFPDASSYIAWSVSALVCPTITFLKGPASSFAASS